MKNIEKKLEFLNEISAYMGAPFVCTASLSMLLKIQIGALSYELSAVIFGFVAFFIGVYFYDDMLHQRTLSSLYEREAIFKAEQERLVKELRDTIRSEENSRWWDENFAEVCSWRNEITGKGV